MTVFVESSYKIYQYIKININIYILYINTTWHKKVGSKVEIAVRFDVYKSTTYLAARSLFASQCSCRCNGYIGERIKGKLQSDIANVALKDIKGTQ